MLATMNVPSKKQKFTPAKRPPASQLPEERFHSAPPVRSKNTPKITNNAKPRNDSGSRRKRSEFDLNKPLLTPESFLLNAPKNQVGSTSAPDLLKLLGNKTLQAPSTPTYQTNQEGHQILQLLQKSSQTESVDSKQTSNVANTSNPGKQLLEMLQGTSPPKADVHPSAVRIPKEPKPKINSRFAGGAFQNCPSPNELPLPSFAGESAPRAKSAPPQHTVTTVIPDVVKSKSPKKNRRKQSRRDNQEVPVVPKAQSHLDAMSSNLKSMLNI